MRLVIIISIQPIMLRRILWLQYSFCANIIRQGGEESSIFRTRRSVAKDRYDLHTLTSIQYMCHLVRTDKYKLTHQENIALFYRMTQVFEILGKSIYYYDEFGVLSSRVISMFKNPEDLASLGTFVKALTRVGMYNEEQWAYICDFIDQQKYWQEHDQVFGLITGFKDTREKFPGSWISQKTVQIYRQLFEPLLLHMRQRRYNLKQMRAIVHCFHKYGVNEDYIWEQVQYFLKTKLRDLESKPFTNHVVVYESQVEKCLFDSKISICPVLEQLVEISYALAINRLPTLEFIQFSQKLVSFYQKNQAALKEEYSRALDSYKQRYQASKTQPSSLPQHRRELSVVYMNPIHLTDQYIIYFLFVLKRSLDYFKEYTVDRHLYEWARNLVFQEQNRFTIGEIILLNHAKDFLQKTQEEMQAFTLRKIKIVRQKSVKIQDLKTLFEIVGRDHLETIQELAIHFLKTNHPSEVYEFTKFCQQYKAYIPRYFIQLPNIVNQHHKYFSFDENCYFYYTLLTNSMYWKGYSLNSYEGQMQILKQTIKTSAFSRGFKIKMDSYFHKLLQHVNMADFFEGGNQ